MEATPEVSASTAFAPLDFELHDLSIVEAVSKYAMDISSQDLNILINGNDHGSTKAITYYHDGESEFHVFMCAVSALGSRVCEA